MSVNFNIDNELSVPDELQRYHFIIKNKKGGKWSEDFNFGSFYRLVEDFKEGELYKNDAIVDTINKVFERIIDIYERRDKSKDELSILKKDLTYKLANKIVGCDNWMCVPTIHRDNPMMTLEMFFGYDNTEFIIERDGRITQV